MKVGDKVKYDNLYYGTIVSAIIPKCRCKGKRQWVVEFENNRIAHIPERDKKLVTIKGFEIQQNLVTHKI